MSGKFGILGLPTLVEEAIYNLELLDDTIPRLFFTSNSPWSQILKKNSLNNVPNSSECYIFFRNLLLFFPRLSDNEQQWDEELYLFKKQIA